MHVLGSNERWQLLLASGKDWQLRSGARGVELAGTAEFEAVEELIGSETEVEEEGEEEEVGEATEDIAAAVGG